MKNIRIALIGVLMCMLAGFAVAASASGIVGDTLISWFVKALEVDPAAALSIYTAIAVALGVIVRVLLKLAPVKLQGIFTVLWNLAAFLFGNGVKLENNKDPEYVKAALTKKYPLLQIDVKSIAQGKQIT